MFSTVSASSSSSSSSRPISSNRDFSLLASSAALQQMTQLANPVMPDVPLCLDPKEFFARFQINTSLFNKEDVELLQNIFQTLKLNPNISLFDVFGLKLRLLIEELRDSFSIEISMELALEWSTTYLQAYLSLLGESPENRLPKTKNISNFSVPPKKYYIFLIDFTKKLTAHVDGILSEKFPTKKSTKLRLHFQKGIEPILTQWNSLIKLLGKCLILPQPSLLLCDFPLVEVPGAHRMKPKSLEEVHEAGRNLYYYASMVSSAYYGNVFKEGAGLCSSYFDEFSDELQPLSYLKTSPEILKSAKKCSNLNSKQIVVNTRKLKSLIIDIERAKNGTLSYETWLRENGISSKGTTTPEDVLEQIIQKSRQIHLELCWLKDLQKVLEDSIISFLDPSFYTTQAYEQRLFPNLEAIGQDKLSVLSSLTNEPMLSEQTDLESQLYNIKRNFFISFQFVFTTLNSLSMSLQTNDGELLKEASVLELIVATMEQFLKKNLTELYNIDPDLCKGKPLLQDLLWLCRIFIFVHDANYILQAASEKRDLDIFPDRFLQFLSLEEEDPQGSESFSDSYSSSRSESESEEGPFSLEPLQFRESLSRFNEDLSITLPDISLAAVGSADLKNELPLPLSAPSEPFQSISNEPPSSRSHAQQKTSTAHGKQKAKARAQEMIHPTLLELRPREPSPPRFPQAIDPRVLLEVKKRRQVEKILKQLGLEPIRTKGSHTVWQHSEDANIQTIVPHHPEIARGTRHAIFEQITGEDA